MMRSLGNAINSVTTGLVLAGSEPAKSTGRQLSEIGLGRPLTTSSELARLTPEETRERMLVSLARISGQQPVFRTRLMFPEDGPSYRVVEGVSWNCPESRREEAAGIVAASFRAAPDERVAAALYRLRLLTRGRDRRADSDREAEAMIWLDLLRGYPGDIVLDVIAKWPTRQGGEFWPTWHEIERELRQRCDERVALLNHLRAPQPKALTFAPESYEARARAVDAWHKQRAEMVAATLAEDGVAAPETPEQALARLSGMAIEDVRAKLAALPNGATS